MNLDQFITKYNGKSIDYDGVYGAQCVDEIKQYLHDCFGMSPGAWGNAADYFTKTNPAILTKFDKVANNPSSPNQVPRRGDIMVWNYTAPGSGGAGHIAIVLSAQPGANSFVSLDQNWNGTYVKQVTHNWGYILGWLTPKQVTQGDIMNQEAGTELYRTALFREPESGAVASQWNGHTAANAMQTLRSTPEWQSLQTKVNAYNALTAQVADLSTRPTKDQLQALVDKLAAEDKQVQALEAQIKQPVLVEDTETRDNTRQILSLVQGLVAKLTNIFK